MKHPANSSLDDHTAIPPLSADRHESLASVRARLCQSGVSVLPVLDGGKLLGLVSQRELALAGQLPDEVLERMTIGSYVVRVLRRDPS